LEEFRPTGRTTLRRLPQRAEYGREAVYQILDEAFVCHVGFVSGGSPFVIPTAYGRAGDVLYLHGARASRMLKELARGPEVCVTVTLLDGLVLARSAFHHSINYRSVVVLGRAEVVEDPSEKMEALRLFTEHIVRGRWDEVREPSPQEMNATLVLRLPLAEASAKVRTGPPVDDEEDMTWPVWAGELPLRLVASEPVADPHTGDGLSAPSYLLDYNRG